MKLAKLSLAAIMAVGAISTVNATQLEEAIKGVELSGYAHYRFHDASGFATVAKPNADEAWSEIELRAQLTAPVQENIQFVTRFTADATTATNEKSGSADPMVDRLFFNYTGFDKTTVTLGRMYVGTPLDDSAALGLKVVSSPVAGLTLAGAYFHDDSATTQALAAVAVIYSNKMFNARVWYVNAAREGAAADTHKVDLDLGDFVPVLGAEVKGADFLFVEAGANVGPVAVKAQYAQRDADALTYTDKTMRIQASGTFGPATVRVGYTTNDDKGGDVTIDGSAEGDNDLIYGGIYGLIQNDDANGESLFAEVKVTSGKFGIKAGYVSYDDTFELTNKVDNQFYGQIDYAMTKKFSTYVRYGSADVDNADDKTLARFNATYKF